MVLSPLVHVAQKKRKHYLCVKLCSKMAELNFWNKMSPVLRISLTEYPEGCSSPPTIPTGNDASFYPSPRDTNKIDAQVARQTLFLYVKSLAIKRFRDLRGWYFIGNMFVRLGTNVRYLSVHSSLWHNPFVLLKQRTYPSISNIFHLPCEIRFILSITLYSHDKSGTFLREVVALCSAKIICRFKAGNSCYY